MRLWQAFEAISSLSAVKAEWQQHLNREFQAISGFLQPEPSLATSYPRLGHSVPGMPIRVVDHGDGTFVGVCDETGEAIPLNRGDLIVYRLDPRVFAARVTSAIGILPTSIDSSWQRPLVLGYTDSAAPQIPVVFTSPCSSDDFFRDVANWMGSKARPCVWLTPTRRFWGSQVEQLIHANGSGLFALQDVISANSKGEWTGTASANDVVSFGCRPVATTDGNTKLHAPLSKSPIRLKGLTAVCMHYESGHRLYLVVINTNREVFDFSESRFREINTVDDAKVICVSGVGTQDTRAEFGYSYRAFIDFDQVARGCSELTEGSSLELHWMLQSDEQPSPRMDKSLESARLQLTNGRISCADVSSQRLFDESLRFAAYQKMRDDKTAMLWAELERQRELLTQLDTAVAAADVPTAIRIVAESVSRWAANLKHHVFIHFHLDAKESSILPLFSSTQDGDLQVFPSWLSASWVGIHEVYDLLEFHKSTEVARGYSQRMDQLIAEKNDFARLLADATRQYGWDLEIEDFIALDERRESLKHRASAVCEYLELVASQMAAAASLSAARISEPIAGSRTTDDDDDDPLNDRSQCVLLAMLELNAFDSDSRKTNSQICVQAMGNASDENALKKVTSNLAMRNYLTSAKGRGGGYWLTAKGRKRAEKLRGDQ